MDNKSLNAGRGCFVRVESVKPRLRVVPKEVATLDLWDEAGFLETMIHFARQHGVDVAGYNFVAVNKAGHCVRGGKLRDTSQGFAMLGGMAAEVYRIAKWINEVQE